jgi:hypothetical protein
VSDFANENMIEVRDDCLTMRARLPFTDVHCHCLPCFDDGPSTMAESLALCRLLAEDFAHRVCIENPSRVVRGQDIAPVVFYNLQEVER